MKNKLVQGVGVYAKGKFRASINSKMSLHYKCWQSMLGRCYNPNYLTEHQSYVGCSVDPIWHDFQTFAQWYEDNYPKDGGKYQLDKDLKVLENKVYSPDTCLFVPSSVNNFIIDRNLDRGTYLIGVSLDKYNGKFKSICSDPINKKQKTLGRFDTELEAHLAWHKFKSEVCVKLAELQTNEEVKQALLRWKEVLDNNLIHCC